MQGTMLGGLLGLGEHCVTQWKGTVPLRPEVEDWGFLCEQWVSKRKRVMLRTHTPSITHALSGVT